MLEQPSTRSADLVTAVLTVLFAATLAIVYTVGDPFVWVGWSIAMVAVSAAALIGLNR